MSGFNAMTMTRTATAQSPGRDLAGTRRDRVGQRQGGGQFAVHSLVRGDGRLPLPGGHGSRARARHRTSVRGIAAAQGQVGHGRGKAVALVMIFALAFGLAWIGERCGETLQTWVQGRRTMNRKTRATKGVLAPIPS